ncbi:bleomycin resistance protein [Yoonia sp. 2307UL14-13]|uniref:bleomycin resistance protein n=1 Tax=Yoonia sp. 2307UL14-13 TaxID=3126506 RepID=UPI0030A03FDC
MTNVEAIPIMRSRNLDETTAFYGTLGFTPERFGDYLILRRPGIELHFCPPDHDDGRETESCCYIRGGGIDALHAEWTAAGIKALSPIYHRPWGMYEFYISDPHGCLMKFGRSDSEGAPPQSFLPNHPGDAT